MSKLPLFRSLLQRSARLGSVRFASIYEHEQHYLFHGFRSFHRHRSFFSLATSTKLAFSDCRPPFAIGIGGIRPFSEDIIRLPEIIDTDVENVFQDLLAASWDELPDPVIKDSMKALSKNTHDKAGQDALASVLRAAEACEEFGGVLVQLRMAIDDSIGMTGENVKQLADDFAHALGEVYKRYTAYLDAFGPEETYLRKKVEIELGTKMIHLKQRCTSLGSDWGGAVTVLGTSGLSGSYVEQRTR